MRTACGLGLGLLAVLAGCRPIAPSVQRPIEPMTLAVTGRALPALDASAAPPAPPLRTPPPPPGNYYQLSAEDCRRHACENSTVANLLDASVQSRVGLLADHGARATAETVRKVTAHYLAEDVRNRSAGGALASYYKLLELELTQDVLTATVAELDDLLVVSAKLVEKGFTEPADVHDLRKQRLELLGTQVRLRSGIQKLNGELKSLLAIDPNTAGLLLPADQVRVVPDPLDVELAVQMGLKLRPELNLLRTLANVVDPRAVKAIRQALVGLAPPLAAVLNTVAEAVPALTPWVGAAAKADAMALRQQVLSLLADRERAAVKEIRTAVEEWTTARELAGLARTRFELSVQRVQEFEKRQKAGESVDADRRRARLEALKAEGELIAEISRWKAADVKARETMGLLCRD